MKKAVEWAIDLTRNNVDACVDTYVDKFDTANRHTSFDAERS